MNCPHCQNELKLETLIDLVREILAKVSHCPAGGSREVFDREFHRDETKNYIGHTPVLKDGVFVGTGETQTPSMAFEDQP
jgi:hypothetical protein